MYKHVDEEITDDYVERNDKLKSKYEFDYKIIKYDRVPDLIYRLRGEDKYKTLVKTRDFGYGKDDHLMINKL